MITKTKKEREVLIDSVNFFVNRAIHEKEFPGGQVIIVKDGELLLDTVYGYTTYDKNTNVDYYTIYDLASFTKCMATTLMAMKLYEDGLLQDSMPLSYYVSKYDSTEMGGIPLVRLLTHSSGLVSSLSLQYQLVYADGERAKLNNWFKGVLHNRRVDGYRVMFSSSTRERLYVYDNIK